MFRFLLSLHCGDRWRTRRFSVSNEDGFDLKCHQIKLKSEFCNLGAVWAGFNGAQILLQNLIHWILLSRCSLSTFNRLVHMFCLIKPMRYRGIEKWLVSRFYWRVHIEVLEGVTRTKRSPVYLSFQKDMSKVGKDAHLRKVWTIKRHWMRFYGPWSAFLSVL